MLSLFVLVFFFHVVVFVFCAFAALIRFNLDLHRYKQTFDFAGRRKKFIDYLLNKELNGISSAEASDQDREEGEKDDS